MTGTAAPPEARRDLSPWQSLPTAARSRRRPLLLLVAALFAASCVWSGFPTGREPITAWVLLLLLAACGGHVRTWARAVVRDWLPLLSVLFLYDLLRGAADELGSRLADLPALRNGKTGADGVDHAHVLPQLRTDEVLFGWATGGQVPTVWLQDRLHTAGEVRWWDVVSVVVYLSHFVVPMGLAVALWLTSYALFRRYVWTLVTLTLATLTTYSLFPAAPPWMAGRNGYLPEVTRVVSATLEATGIRTVESAVQRGEAYANAVAAVPSLHAAVPAMVLLFAWPVVGSRLRALLVVYVAAMTFTLTYGGEHFVVDAVAGALYAAASVAAVRRVLRGDGPQPDQPTAQAVVTAGR